MNQRWTGLLCGLAGGLAGVAAMNSLMRATARFVRPGAPEALDDFEPESSMSLVGPQREPDEIPTEAVARVAYERVARRKPSPETKQRLGEVVHWGYGLTWAAAYGALRCRGERADLLGGALYGAALWAIGDLLALPLLGLTEKPTRMHPTMHLQMLLAHVAYGTALASTAQGTRRGIEAGRERLAARRTPAHVPGVADALETFEASIAQ